MLVPSLICLTIWIWSMVGNGGPIFPWPIFVILGTGGYLSRLVFGKESAIEEERRDSARSRPGPLTGQAESDESVPENDPEVDPEQQRRRDHWR